MKLYAVRQREDHLAIGIYSAATVSDLAWLVDQHANPDDCEYRSVTANTGIYFEGEFRIGHHEKLDEEDGDKRQREMSNFDIVETMRGGSGHVGLMEVLFGMSDVKGWKPFYEASDAKQLQAAE